MFKTSIILSIILVITSFVSTGFTKNHIETKEKCFQFKVEQPNICQEMDMEKSKIRKLQSTWLVEWGQGSGPCKVEVFAAYGDEVTCENVKDYSTIEKASFTTREEGEEKKLEITATYNKKTKKLSDVLLADDECRETWMRFVDENGCNFQIIWIGGIPFIIP